MSQPDPKSTFDAAQVQDQCRRVVDDFRSHVLDMSQKLPDTQKLMDDVCTKLKTDYVILPRWLWKALVVVVALFAGVLGVTSYFGFGEAVSRIAAVQARTEAEAVAKSVATKTAEDLSPGLVRQVFESAMSSARTVASETTKHLVESQVRQEVAEGAKKAVEKAIEEALGKDVVTNMKRAESDAAAALIRIRDTEHAIGEAPLAQLAQSVAALPARIGASQPMLEVDRLFLDLGSGQRSNSNGLPVVSFTQELADGRSKAKAFKYRAESSFLQKFRSRPTMMASIVEADSRVVGKRHMVAARALGHEKFEVEVIVWDLDETGIPDLQIQVECLAIETSVLAEKAPEHPR